MAKLKASTKKTLLIALPILAVLLIGGGVWALTRGNTDNDSTGEETSQTTETDDSTTPSQPATADDGTPLADEKPDSTAPSGASITMTAQYFDKSTNKAYVKAIVEKANSGTCKAIFSKSGQKSVTASASVQIVTSYYACGDLSVAKSKFPVKGTWSVKVQLIEEGSVSATSDTETVTIP